MISGGVININGNGVAAIAAAAVLSKFDAPAWLADSKVESRLVTLNRPTQELIIDLFGAETLIGFLPCGGRLVEWDLAGEHAYIDDGSIITTLDVLLNRMREQISICEEKSSEGGRLKINAGGRNSNSCLVAPPPLRTCYWNHLEVSKPPSLLPYQLGQRIKAGKYGWTFCAERPDGTWFAQVTTLSNEFEVASNLLADAFESSSIGTIPKPDGWINTAPALGSVSLSSDELRTGDAAVTYDPLCGDGCGHAIRSGVMAAAIVLRSREYFEEYGKLLDWYRSRLRSSYVQHLDACANLYGRSPFAKHWENYIENLVKLSRRIKLIEPNIEAGFTLKNMMVLPLDN